jgi:hypothetical protein
MDQAGVAQAIERALDAPFAAIERAAAPETKEVRDMVREVASVQADVSDTVRVQVQAPFRLAGVTR